MSGARDQRGRQPAARSQTVRCAIYTRKSSEEGLEQAFNSLDAQREACSAYILSQASEGWSEVTTCYDDGGLSGGTLERPALRRLLADVREKRVDIIVVYKVYRLTRSLLDFAKLVEAFDAAGTSFVSVTQSFNTTTSMGRLTLNMLLSFAQFEREVTAERIRDKIAASKAKGMWMGGIPPLGYRGDGRTLAVVDDDADLVRTIFRRYLELGDVRLLAEALAGDGLVAPERTLTSGKRIGGGPLTRGQLSLMLRNRIYVGEIAHKDQVHPGLHPAIVDRALFEAVQAKLTGNLQGHRDGVRTRSPSLLAGRLVDEEGAPLVAMHATARQCRYRYYVSKALHAGDTRHGLRLPAREIEVAVTERVAQLLDDPLQLAADTGITLPAHDVALTFARAAELAAKLRQRDRVLTRQLVAGVQVGGGRLTIDVTTARLAAALKLEQAPGAPASVTITCDLRLARSGPALRLVQTDGTRQQPEPSEVLVRLIAQGHHYWRDLRQGELQIGELAAREGISRAYVARLLRLAFLSPAVVEAVLAGKQRTGLNAESIKAVDAVDPDWKKQALAFLPAQAGRSDQPARSAARAR